jgi:hypothetical protein
MFEGFRVERGGHHHEFEVWAQFLLEGDGTGEGDVAVEVALMKLVENNTSDAFEERVGEHHPQEDTFGDETDAGALGGDAVHPDLVANFVAEALTSFGGNALSEHSSWEAARLEDEDFTRTGELVIQDELGYLRGFSGTGGRLENDSGVCGEGFAEVCAEFVDGECVG